MAGILLKVRFPRRQMFQTVISNLFRYMFRGAARNWIRNIGSIAPALGSMALLLLMAGMAGLIGFALHNLEQVEATQASLLHVYVRDTAAPAEGRVARSAAGSIVCDERRNSPVWGLRVRCGGRPYGSSTTRRPFHHGLPDQERRMASLAVQGASGACRACSRVSSWPLPGASLDVARK